MPDDAATEAVRREVDSGDPPGATWVVDRGGRVSAGSAGVFGPDDDRPVEVDTVFRIASVTKPVVAVAAWTLLDDGTLDLDAPVTRWLPELADRRVLRDPAGPIDDTVPAARDITVRDVLTLRLGIGMDFAGPFPGPVLTALHEAGLAVGPPAPQRNPAPDAWMAAVGSVPLTSQPGTRWLYHTGMEVLGVLLARAGGAPLPDVLRERVLEPVGMRDTGFGVGPDQAGRFGTLWTPPGDDDGGRTAYDLPDGQWARLPVFPGGGDGLVSTVTDLHALARTLRDGGVAPDGTRVVREETVRAATVAHGGDVEDGHGWGLGVGVLTADQPDGRRAGAYGWDGGLGSTWWVDPVADVIAVLLTNQMWPSPQHPPVFEAFLRAAWSGRGRG